MMKLTVLIAGALILLQACTAQNKKQQMKEIIDDVASRVTTYEKRPIYGLQVNKNGCRIIIQIEDGLDYRFTENTGESMMVPLNVMMFGSGNKTAIIKVYPREGETLLTKEAYVNLSFTYAPDKDSGLNDYVEIASFSLPEKIGKLELPYFETRIPFEVSIPFDYNGELERARDLKSLSDLEDQAKQKYDQLVSICENFDEIGYLREKIHSSFTVFNSLYDSSRKDITKGYETKFAVIDTTLYNREFLPIENFEIQYYADNKIVALWQKNLKPLLYIKGNYKYSSGEEAYFESGSPIFLYLPEGSDELKVW